jgi:hypothetical protein
MCSSTFGPAIDPALVTCPTMNTLVPLDLATACKRDAHSRTCEIDPAADVSSLTVIVWIESTMARRGLSVLMCPTISSRSVSGSR